MHHNQTIYLKGMLNSPNYRPTRDLRSSYQNVLAVPRIRTKMGEECLSVATPKIVEQSSL